MMKKAPVFKGVSQVGIVVKNCMATVKRYVEDFGISPWGIYEMTPETVNDMEINGKPTHYAFRAALSHVGETMIELIEPLDDKSIYADFLREHGEGLHHVLFDVEDYEKTLSFFQGKGMGVLQGGNNKGLKYAYFDTTKDLGFFSEIIGVPDGTPIPEPDYVYPEEF